jgi:hypothetical protein
MPRGASLEAIWRLKAAKPDDESRSNGDLGIKPSDRALLDAQDDTLSVFSAGIVGLIRTQIIYLVSMRRLSGQTTEYLADAFKGGLTAF